MKRNPLFLLVILWVLTGCHSNNRLVLLTDEIDSVVAAELFNKQSDDIKIIVHYQPDLVKVLYSGKINADIVIGHDLNSPSINKKMISLRSTANKHDLYDFMLITNRKIRLLPLSFDLPVILFSETNGQNLNNPQLIGSPELKELGRSFNQKGPNGMTRVGFLPLRYDEFLYMTAVSHGSDIRLSGKTLQYNEPALLETITFLEDWSQTENGGSEKEKKFIEKYGYIPDVRLLEDKKILFSLSGLSDFLELPEHDRDPLDFRYFSFGNTIPVNKMVYFGIPSGSLKSGKSKKFLAWLLMPETQKSLMEYKQKKRMGRFGFFGGLSTLPEVNEAIIGKVYPVMLGRIPDSKYLEVPPESGDNWLSIKKQVIIPWIRKRIFGESDKDLVEFYSEWLYFTVSE
jgi:hypothetical protein